MEFFTKKHKALMVIASTLFFVYVHFGYGIERKYRIDLPMVSDELFFQSLAIWVTTLACMTRFLFVGTKWVKPVTACFYIAFSYLLSEILGTSAGHFSIWSFLLLLLISGLIAQREVIKWYLEKKKLKTLYIIFGFFLTWN